MRTPVKTFNAKDWVVILVLVLLGLSHGGISGGRAGVDGANDIFVNSGQALGNSQTRAVGLGDLDGDGDLDAFAVNDSTGERVWLNDGSAVFNDSGQSLGSESSKGVALGDVDGDDDLDAFVAASLTNKLWVNQGGDQGGSQGVFTDSGQSLGSALSQGVALGDLDGDLDLDAFVANFGGANTVWVNQGGSQGGTPGVFNSGQALGFSGSYAVALGDVDRDGDLDALVANYLQVDWLWVNQGRAQGGTQGVFAQGDWFSGPNCFDVALGDLDGDGDLDAFFANYEQGNMVFVNQGGAQGGTEGTFSDSGELLGAAKSRAVALGDVDGDGDLDAVVANYQEPDAVWLNDGAGVFTHVQGMDNVLSFDLALGDLDGNGSLDVFVANQMANNVWLGGNRWTGVDPAPNSHSAALGTNLHATTEGAYDPTTVLTETFIVHGGFLGRVAGHIPSLTGLVSAAGAEPGAVDISRAWFYPDETFFPGELVQATLTGGIIGQDGIPFAPYVWQFRTVVMDGSGIFSDTLQMLGEAASLGAALGDFDADGDLDAFVVNGTDQADQIWINAGGNQGGTPGDFTAGGSLGNTTSLDVAVGDLDGDGHPDLFVSKDGPNVVYRNIGTGVFGQLTTVGDADSRAAALGDLDSDGDLDALVANYAANVVWTNIGSGHFAPFPLSLGDANSWDVALGDLDDDGDLDAVVANLGVNEVWLNDGTGAFTGKSLGADWTPSYGVALGDLNGDSALDAFFANYAAANQVWLNDGTGTLTVTQSLGTSPSNAVALGDLDGDGDLDAFVANYSNQPNEVWLNDGNGTFSDSEQTLAEAYSWDVALGDLDGDGDLDAFVANTTQPNKVWENTDLPANGYRVFLPLTLR